MKDKVCIVTGANAGIGKATALGLAQMGATVVMVCRDEGKGKVAQAEIKAQTGNDNVHLLLADLSSQTDVRKLADDFQAQFERLDVLINNAGIIPGARQVSVDGIEIQLAVNHLAPFLLANLLLDTLKASAPARVLTVSSQVHAWDAIDWEDLQSEKSYSPNTVYNRSKLMNVLFTYELARRLEGTGVTANCLHPGVVNTNMLADYMGSPREGFSSGVPVEEGARTSLYLATSSDVEGVSGKYFREEREADSSPDSHDEEQARRLWDLSVVLTGLEE
ncbi:MAG: SDR family NAD(P)-dependent oxidoreductase [Chloroflexi bacterium]|nr:MAG: SDR family NAD(P)-dependent oxidoreductase [Chloroflexota bacterium]MBL1193995.1 SDR family oxidoreductase [Chloroflexota bacterium]NOH11289.1 SDR family oxidoreductase [Chloroflexota bacterium]